MKPCPCVCARAFSEHTVDYDVVICMDAVTKPGHYSKCAMASAECDLEPRISLHYGAPDKRARELHATGRLNLQHLAPLPGQQQVTPTDEENCCTAQLSCSRPNSKAAGARDIHGVVGAVCTHGVPLRESFVDLYVPECFSYYLIILTHILVAAMGAIKTVYIDFACRLTHTYQRHLQHTYRQEQAQAPSALADVNLCVNWMHASSHNMECQLQNSGR